MHIILVSDRLATAKTVTITPRLVAGGAVLLTIAVLLLSFGLSWLSLHLRLPFVQDMLVAVQQQENEKAQSFLRENLNAMAERVGEIQAKVLRLDTLGDRLMTMTGFKANAEEQEARRKPGPTGGPLVLPLGGGVSEGDLQKELERISLQVEYRADVLTMLEDRLLEERLKKSMIPTVLPIRANYVGSSFGTRLDPIAGVRAMHEGIDFVADVGTPVSTAAAGVVVLAERHAEYGMLIEIDHGNAFSTRYAHLSRMDVKPGQIVKRGEGIGASGNTGRSTGPHLHFEVRYKGVAQNPARFLRQDDARLAAATPRR